MGKADTGSATRNNRSICVPISQEIYSANIADAGNFREYLDECILSFPELFPPEISKGYRMKDIYYSQKLSIPIRRIDIGGIPYTIRPSFVMPYMTGVTGDIEKALFMRKFGVPFWALSHVFGKDPMYWYRIEQTLGRNSIVGTTVRNPLDIPENLVADEKHTWILGNKAYIATTVGNGCILGASIAKDAGEEALMEGYGVFKNEATRLNPEYAPKTANTDGWKATRKAWTALFPSIAIICCFLHIFIKIRDRAKKKYKAVFLSAQYFHGSRAAAELRIRGWALIQNFAPWCPATVKQHGHKSPAERLNRFCYSESWIENLLISALTGGYRTPPQNPI